MNTDWPEARRVTRRGVLHAGMAALAAACRGSAFAWQQTTRRTGPSRDGDPNDPLFRTPTEPVNTPIGIGKGIHPGRVSWAHRPQAALWDGKTGNWWDDANTDGKVVAEMISGVVRSLAGEKSDRAAWRSLFAFFKQAQRLGGGGYRPGETIAIKLNNNQDRPGAWRMGSGMPSPHVVYALVSQLITEAGIRGQDIVIYDASRYIGDPIYDRIRADKDSEFQAVRFAVSQRMAGNGRAPAEADKENAIRFSAKDVPTAYAPKCATEAAYMINVALSRAHTLMGASQTAKNWFGSVYFDGPGFSPQPLHDFASRERPMGSYNCLVDLIAYKHLGGKTLLYMADFLYVAESQNARVIRYQSFDNHWCSSVFASQDPVAIDSVALDFIRNEPTADECRGYPENYLHEAALAGKAPSGTVYNPNPGREPAESLGVHEHWNSAAEKKYSRNLGKKNGIELVRV